MTHDANGHRPVLRLTVTYCPNPGGDDGLDVDVRIGPPVPGWTAEEVAGGVLDALHDRLVVALDQAWRSWHAARN